MSEKIHYPNSWYVKRYDDVRKAWSPIPSSVGNKSYAMGFLNALCEFSPRPLYRLITNKGELFEVRAACGPVNLNGGGR